MMPRKEGFQLNGLSRSNEERSTLGMMNNGIWPQQICVNDKERSKEGRED